MKMPQFDVAWEPNWNRPVYGYPTGLTVALWNDDLEYLTVIFQTNFGQWHKRFSDCTPEQRMQIRKALMDMEEAQNWQRRKND